MTLLHFVQNWRYSTNLDARFSKHATGLLTGLLVVTELLPTWPLCRDQVFPQNRKSAERYAWRLARLTGLAGSIQLDLPARCSIREPDMIDSRSYTFHASAGLFHAPQIL